MTVNLVVAALLISAVGAAALGYCALRLYAAFTAMGFRRRARVSKSVSAIESEAEETYNPEFLKELRAASHRMVLALLAGFALLCAMWFFGAWSERALSLTLMEAFAITACAVFLFSQLTRLAASLLPGTLKVRRGLVAAMKRMNFVLLLIASLYAMGCWVFSL